MIREKNKRVLVCACERCGFEWEWPDPKTKPVKCKNRKCKSPYWNVARGVLPVGNPNFRKRGNKKSTDRV